MTRLVARRKAEQNQAVVDPWTGVHLAAGLAAGLMGMGLAVPLAGAILYEVLELHFENSDAGRRFFNTSGPEIHENAVVDVAVFVLGWSMGNRWNAS